MKRFPRYPPVFGVDVVREAPFIRRVLGSYQIPAHDLPDLVQETLFAAWRGIKAGRFCPKPGVPLRLALRRWLSGITWRQASHYRDRAHRRWEILYDQLPGGGEARRSPEDLAIARLLLQHGFGRLPRRLQDVLALATLGLAIFEIARELGIPQGTASNYLNAAKQQFARACGVRVRRRSRRRRR